jgi:hypothetical protein
MTIQRSSAIVALVGLIALAAHVALLERDLFGLASCSRGLQSMATEMSIVHFFQFPNSVACKLQIEEHGLAARLVPELSATWYDSLWITCLFAFLMLFPALKRWEPFYLCTGLVLFLTGMGLNNELVNVTGLREITLLLGDNRTREFKAFATGDAKSTLKSIAVELTENPTFVFVGYGVFENKPGIHFPPLDPKFWPTSRKTTAYVIAVTRRYLQSAPGNPYVIETYRRSPVGGKSLVDKSAVRRDIPVTAVYAVELYDLRNRCFKQLGDQIHDVTVARRLALETFNALVKDSARKAGCG